MLGLVTVEELRKSQRKKAPFEPVGRGGVPLDQLIEDQVAEVHGDVDEVLHRMQESDEYKLPELDAKHEHKKEHHAHRDAEDSDSDQPDFRSQTPEAEESTFNRHGPLTIPEVPEKLPTPSHDVEDLSPIHPHPFSGGFETHPRPPTPPKDISEETVKPGGFETHPRPPTPPKDISEETVKPSAFSLAHSSHTPVNSHHDGLHSILKHGSSQYGSSAEPWFDFKSVDPKRELSDK
ncbi:unnamed protein product [Nippostrongylus brasiliensis]|uniref:Organ specific protein n=1 Tax=Nippostrongylus brasiliensis TaxID=27835 RepID=A0A0N4YTZ2_NIPBR|nr:unnamed protein product [Nippostrongylus brasiliensis]